MSGPGASSARPAETLDTAADTPAPLLPSRGNDVPLSRSHIRKAAQAYLPRHPHERESLAGLLSLLEGDDHPADRATLPGHVTCSAVVIDREQRVLHIGHRGTGLLLNPGGHIEEDRTLLAAALREACEETGLRPGDLCLTSQFLGSPIDIDVHDIEANPAKGEGAHQHFDFRFVFYLLPEQHPRLALQDEEVSGARPVAALLAGGLGTWIGVRPARTAGTLLLLVPLVVLARSPIRALRQMPEPPPAAQPSPPAARTAPPAMPSPARTDGVRHNRVLGGDAP